MRMTFRRKKAMRSQRRSASSRLCVQRKTVRPSPRSCTINSRTVFAASGSRPVVGSSRKRSRGSSSAVGPQEAEHFSLADLEVDAVHRDELAEPLGQLVGSQHRLHWL